MNDTLPPVEMPAPDPGPPVPDARYLTVSAAAQVAYCPRSFWYEMLHGRRKARNEFVEAGFLEDQDRLDRYKRELPDAVIHLGVHVVHQGLGLRGQVDAVLDDGKTLRPVEYRHGVSPGTPVDRVAVALIGMALEEAVGRPAPVARLFFHTDRQETEVNLDETLRAEAVACVHRARAILDAPAPPSNPLGPRCRGCSWHDTCAPDLSAAARSERAAKVLPRRRFDRVLYVQEPGSHVHLKASAVEVTREKQVVVSLGIQTVDQVVLVGRGVHASIPSVRALAEAGVDVVMMRGSGSYEGRFVAEGLRNPALRRAQHRRSLDPAFRLAASRAIVEGKVHNQRVQLMRLQRTRPSPVIEESLTEMQRLLRRLPAEAKNQDALRGFEGQAARLYFRGIDAALEGTPFSMERRSRRPPVDPFNALLSFCYGLLAKDLESAILLAGLDPCLGLFHSEVYGRAALVLDLMEEFRPVVADAVALRLVNHRMLREDHFERGLSGVRLTAPGRRRLFEAWEGRMNEKIRHPQFGVTFSVRRTMEAQARLLAKVFEGDVEGYLPLRMR